MIKIIVFLKYLYRSLGFTTAAPRTFRNYIHRIALEILGAQPSSSKWDKIPKSKNIPRIAIFPGIGDAIWSLIMIKSYMRKYGFKKIDLVVSSFGIKGDPRANRSKNLLSNFTFVRHIYAYPFSIHKSGKHINASTGYPEYISSGEATNEEKKFCDYKMLVNSALEHGNSFLDFSQEFNLPYNNKDINIFNSYNKKKLTTTTAKQINKFTKKYFVFYCSALIGNTENGFNRGALWKIDDWVNLAKKISNNGYKIIFVGAEYDLSYFKLIKKTIGLNFYQNCISLVGECNMEETLSVIKSARAVIGYPSGIPICSTYMAIRTVMFWRPQHLPLSPTLKKYGFDEKFSVSWVPQKMLKEKKYIPAWFGKDNYLSVYKKMEDAKWI